MREASGHIIELTVRLRELEALLKESRSRETKLLKDLEEMKRRHREAKEELSQLTGVHAKPASSPKDSLPICLSVRPSILPSVVDAEELQQHRRQSSTQREEIIRLKQELQLLHRDLLLSGASAARAAAQQARSAASSPPASFFLQERETAGKMSCWNWPAPNRSAPCRSCAASSRYAEVSPALPPSLRHQPCFLIPPELRHLSGPAA